MHLQLVTTSTFRKPLSLRALLLGLGNISLTSSFGPSLGFDLVWISDDNIIIIIIVDSQIVRLVDRVQ